MKKFFKILGLLSLLAIIALGANGGCGCPGPGTGTPGPGPGTGTPGLGKITGYVSSSVSETTRIPGATITVTGGGKTYTTITDGMGSYTISVPAGTYTVSASKETFNTKTQDNVTVTADGTTTLNFALTTGSGGTIQDPGVGELILWVSTNPSQFDIRSIVGRVTSKSDIKDLIKSLPVLRDTGGDYKNALSLFAEFTSTPPSGTQGTRLYIGTSSNGPFILMTSGGTITFFPLPNVAMNGVGNFQPDTTYYLYPSLYGTWGETVLSPEPIEFKIPKKLGLIQPDNNYTIPSNTTIHFEWDNLGEGWEYSIIFGDVEGITTVFAVGGILNSYYDIYPIQMGVGEYLWRVMGEYYTSSSQGEITIEKWYSSYSYPRKIIVVQSNP